MSLRLSLLALLALGACSDAPSADAPGGGETVARVGDARLTEGDVANALGDGPVGLDSVTAREQVIEQWVQRELLVQEARRQIEICNACRYCEGYCSVFPAITRNKVFASGDITQLANLCHNCRGCYHACQYTAPHEFDLNLPKALGAARVDSWERFAWPSGLARLLQSHAAGLVVAGLSGFASLGAEVVWTRQLSLLFGATVYNFSLILAVFLSGIGGGSLAGAWAARRTARVRAGRGSRRSSRAPRGG